MRGSRASVGRRRRREAGSGSAGSWPLVIDNWESAASMVRPFAALNCQLAARALRSKASTLPSRVKSPEEAVALDGSCQWEARISRSRVLIFWSRLASPMRASVRKGVVGDWLGADGGEVEVGVVGRMIDQAPVNLEAITARRWG